MLINFTILNAFISSYARILCTISFVHIIFYLQFFTLVLTFILIPVLLWITFYTMKLRSKVTENRFNWYFLFIYYCFIILLKFTSSVFSRHIFYLMDHLLYWKFPRILTTHRWIFAQFFIKFVVIWIVLYTSGRLFALNNNNISLFINMFVANFSIATQL